MLKRCKGFTLIELMIVVAVIAVLASIAYPSYINFIVRNDRLDAIDALAEIQLAQERRRMQGEGYTDNLADLGLTTTSSRGLYTLGITEANRGGFTVVASAQGSQTRDTDCLNLTLTVNMSGEQRTPAQCW